MPLTPAKHAAAPERMAPVLRERIYGGITCLSTLLILIQRSDSDSGLVGPESRRTSRDLVILVDEAAASIASSDLVELGSSAVEEWREGAACPKVRCGR
jgi:hypothetical protein